MKPMMEICDLAKWYPHRGKQLSDIFRRQKDFIKAVDGVSLSIESGEILGVIGESGCGKSTMGRLITRLEEPSHGDVLIQGESTAELLKRDPLQFRRKVQIVFQNPFDTFTPRDTIRRILLRPLKHHKIGENEEERLAIIREALSHEGLVPVEDILDRYPHELSGGQLQRISIIRAMLLKPRIVVADEPVSMLDVSVRADIINALEALARGEGASVIFISHDIALTRYLADHVAVMYLGRIVEYGQADEVVKTPAHPYTEALISNCASIDPLEKREIIPIEGEPPTPLNPGPGCYFAPRCTYATDQCQKAYPPETEVANGHRACCWRLSKSGNLQGSTCIK